MYSRKALRMVRLGLVAAMVVAPLMVSTGTAVAYDEEQKGNVPGEEYDEFDSKAVIDVVLDSNNDGNVTDPPTGGDIKITGFTLYGRTKILRSTPAGDDGNDPRAGEPDTLNDIATEMVRMELTGFGYILRAGSEFGLPPSIGAIEELATGTDFPAYSFFDIYFELTGTIWGTLTNAVPARMAATINEIPPYGVDYNLVSIPPVPPVILKDGGGITRVLITNVHRHTVLWPDGVPVFPNWYAMMAAVAAAGGLGFLIWRRLLKRA